MSTSLANGKAEWTRTKLGALSGERGKSINPAKTPERKFELYSIPSFPDRKPEVVSGKEVGSNKQLVEPNAVLLGKINPRINRAWVVGDFTPHTKIASTEWIVFPASEEVIPDFLCYFLQQNAVRDFLAHNASGVGGSLMRVKPSTLRDFPFSYPGRVEQQRIVAEIEKQFTRLEAGVTALRRVQANLKRYRGAVLKAASEGRLVPTEAEIANAENRKFETGEELLARILTDRRENWQGRGKYKESAAADTANLPPLPEGWTWCMSDAAFSFITSGSRGWAEYYCDTGPLFLRIGNLEHENIRLDLNELQHVAPPTGAEGTRTVVQANDILISITADVGMVGLVPEGLGEAYINQHVALARPLPSISPSYVAYYLCASEGGWGHLKKLQRGATKVGLGLDDIRAVPVPLPPLAEQTRIVAEVERRLSVVEELESVVTADVQRGSRLRQSILQRAFSRG